ncbi:MAG: hypothetical protein ACM3VZ_00470 [Acidobacteriota bacterium]
MSKFANHIACFVLACAHTACTAVDHRAQEAGISQMDGQPCFSVNFPKASVLELAGIEVHERTERGVRPVWEVTFPIAQDGGEYLRSVQCLRYGIQYPKASEIKQPSPLVPGRRYEADILVYAWTAETHEQRAYNFKANFCMKRNENDVHVVQVPWIEKGNRWEWSICD